MNGSSSILVDVNPEIALKLAAFVADLQSDKSVGTVFLNECNELAVSSDISVLIDKILSQNNAIFGSENASGKLIIQYLLTHFPHCIYMSCFRY